MIVEFRILPIEDILKDKGVDVSKGKAILVHTKYEISFVDGQVNEHPESIRFWISQDQKVADYEVDPLGVTHGGEVVRNPLEYILKDLSFFYFEGEGSIEVLFYLLKTLVVLRVSFEFVVRSVSEGAIIFYSPLLIRYYLFFISNLKTQTSFVNLVPFVRPVQQNFPFFHDWFLDSFI